MTAYHFLMASENSAYKKFIELRESDIVSSNRFNVYDFKQNVGVECALWPNLYPTIDLCMVAENRHSKMYIYFYTFKNKTIYNYSLQNIGKKNKMKIKIKQNRNKNYLKIK